MIGSVGLPLLNNARFCPVPRLTRWLLAIVLIVSGGMSAGNALAQAESGPALDDVSPADISAWLQDIPLKTTRKGILPEETELYYRVLEYTQQVDPEVLEREAIAFLRERWENSKYSERPFSEFPIFVDMYKHPEAYQGRPVIMHGHLQRSVVGSAGSNDYGIDSLCEAWLFTDDSQSHPTVVVSTAFPPDLPVGEEPVDKVTAVGYIYRLYTYEARDAGRFAPLLMAQPIRWSSPAERSEDDSWLGLVFGFMVMLTISAWLALRWNQQVRKATGHSLGRDYPPEIISPEESRSEVKLPRDQSDA